jgi:hypothetical protein
MVDDPATPDSPPVQVLTAFADSPEVLGVGNEVCEEDRSVGHLHAATGRAGVTAVGVMLLELALTAARWGDAETRVSPYVFRF